MKRDNVFSEKLEQIEDFTFGADVVDVFPDMIRRSVPGYKTIIDFIGIMAGQYVTPNSHCYDLGCSLGASSFSILKQVNHFDYKIIAVDNSEKMTERFGKIIEREVVTVPLEINCADIRDIEITNASFVVMNFTLQFITPSARKDIIEKIYAGLNPGGVLILSEKLLFPQIDEQTLINESHYAFKRANGYSELEISQKRTALEDVLIADTADEHISRFKESGFSNSMQWFQCLNFASFMAIK